VIYYEEESEIFSVQDLYFGSTVFDYAKELNTSDAIKYAYAYEIYDDQYIDGADFFILKSFTKNYHGNIECLKFVRCWNGRLYFDNPCDNFCTFAKIDRYYRQLL